MRVSITLGVLTAVFVFCMLAFQAHAKEINEGDLRMITWDAYKSGWNDGANNARLEFLKNLGKHLDEVCVKRDTKTDKDQSRVPQN